MNLIIWEELDLGEHLPDFGQEYYADASTEMISESLTLKYSNNIDHSKFESYMQECKEFGYTIGAYYHDNVYMACNEEGYYLHLSYVNECIDNGFNRIIQQNDYFLKAENKDGILVILKYLGCDTMSFFVSDTNK